MFHPSDPSAVARCGACRSAAASYHVGLDTMMGRRSRHRPEEVAIDGFPAARHRRVRARHRAHPARRLLEDEGARHPSGMSAPRTGLALARPVRLSRRQQRLAGRRRPRAAHDRGPAGSEVDMAREPRRRCGGTPSPRGRGPRARAGRSRIRALTIRASGSSGCRFARSIRSIGWPSNRKVPASSRPCTCATCSPRSSD